MHVTRLGAFTNIFIDYERHNDVVDPIFLFASRYFFSRTKTSGTRVSASGFQFPVAVCGACCGGTRRGIERWRYSETVNLDNV